MTPLQPHWPLYLQPIKHTPVPGPLFLLLLLPQGPLHFLQPSLLLFLAAPSLALALFSSILLIPTDTVCLLIPLFFVSLAMECKFGTESTLMIPIFPASGVMSAYGIQYLLLND